MLKSRLPLVLGLALAMVVVVGVVHGIHGWQAPVAAPAPPAPAAGQAAPTPPTLPPPQPPVPVHSKLPGSLWPPLRRATKTSPALSPAVELRTISVPPGYHVELVAAEPMVESPIVMEFDADGRLWVVEAPGFIPEVGPRDKPGMGRVVVLEDTNGDGVMDKRTVFADAMDYPRAIRILDHAVLVGDPPNVWLMKDTNGDLKADTKDLVVNTFGRADGGYEHNANSFLWAMDNVMYSSEHTWNLRFKNGKIEPQPTLSRGQWLISQDDAGRVYRNVNDAPLFVDYTPAQYFLRNPNGVRTRGLYESVIEQMDALVYPVRSNYGVNRGYREEYLRADGSSIIIQGAGGPTIYRGDKYPRAARGNAFITDSPTNLVHQFVLVDDGTGRLSAKNAYPRGEFFASSDERCRPVSTYSGPDGNIYIADMYRGVIQAGNIWSDYNAEYIKTHEMQLPVGKGRIWRVVYGTGPARRGPTPSLSAATAAQLVQTLAHPNGWWRDTAQQLLILRGETSTAPALKMLVRSAPDWRTRLHALWTLDGLGQIDTASVDLALVDVSPDVRAAGIRISERWLGQPNQAIASSVLKLGDDKNWNVRRQLAASIGELPAAARVDPAVSLLRREGNDPIIVDAVLSGLNGVEAEVLSRVLQTSTATPPATETPVEAVTMLSAIVAKSSNLVSVQQVLDAVADASRPAWQRRALLDGLNQGLPALGARAGRGGGRGAGGGGVGLPGISTPGARATVTPGRGVTLPAEPLSLTTLASGTDEVAALARSVAARLDWAGKPPPPPAPPVTPLTADEQKRFDAGKELYASLCAACHNLDGQGKDKLGPSLVTSKYVQAAAAFPIRIVTGGKEGPVGLMPPLVGTLTDEQIAAALTYIRREWGHTAAPISAIEVRETRQSSVHKGPWTETELAAQLAGGGRGGRGAPQ